MIKDGKIYNKAAGTSYSLMAVRQDGMMYTPEQGLSANQLVRSGVKDKMCIRDRSTGEA